MAEAQETGIKELREAADRGRKASQELDEMKREMAFLKAGVDTDTKAGQLLFKAYDGDLDPDLLRIEAEELGILKGADPKPELESEVTEADTQVAQQRRDLVSDQVPPDTSTESPYDVGHRQFKEMVDAGRPVDDAAAAFVSTVIEAATSGDERVLSR